MGQYIDGGGEVNGGLFPPNQFVKHLPLVLEVISTQREAGGFLQTSVCSLWGPGKAPLWLYIVKVVGQGIPKSLFWGRAVPRWPL